MCFSNPSQNIEQIDLQSGASVADLGTGSGFYALAAAKAVGDKGKVYAIDVQKELLEKLKREAIQRRIHNINVIWGNVEKVGGTKIRDGAVDFVIAANLLFQIEHKMDFMAEIRRILKPKGKLLLIDWQDSFGGLGPTSGHVVRENDGRALFESAGFVFEKPIRAGAHHWGVIFRKN